MTVTSERTIEDRITTATSESPIAVFDAKKYDPRDLTNKTILDAVFASTFHTRDRIQFGDPNFIGCYHGLGGAEKFMSRKTTK
jgi:hypothetical protein